MIEHYVATQEAEGRDYYPRHREFVFEMISSLDIAEIPLTERYPDAGYAHNTECNLIVRIMKGRALLFTPSIIRTLKENATSETSGEKGVSFGKGETVSIPKNTPYYWIAEIPTIFLVVSTPTWSKEQQKIVFL